MRWFQTVWKAMLHSSSRYKDVFGPPPWRLFVFCCCAAAKWLRTRHIGKPFAVRMACTKTAKKSFNSRSSLWIRCITDDSQHYAVKLPGGWKPSETRRATRSLPKMIDRKYWKRIEIAGKCIEQDVNNLETEGLSPTLQVNNVQYVTIVGWVSTLHFLAAPVFHDVQETLHMSLLPPVEHVVDFEFENVSPTAIPVAILWVIWRFKSLVFLGVTTKRIILWKNYERSQKITNLEDPWDW